MTRLLLAALILSPLSALAQTPPEGVPLKVRRGFFTETDVGAFLTLGGEDTYSNAQTYLQLGVGYDVSENISLGFNVGIGSSAANCFSTRGPAGDCQAPSANGGVEQIADNFTMTFLNLTAAYMFKMVERFYFSPKLTGGYTLLEPAPVKDSSLKAVSNGPNMGAGVGIEYATHMDHFSIGADVTARYVIGPNILGLAIFPRVKYTF